MIYRIDRIPGNAVPRLIPGRHKLITDAPREAKDGDTIVLLHVCDSQSAKVVSLDLKPDGRLYAEVDIVDNQPMVYQSEPSDPKDFSP